jgi:MFS family permease
VVSGLWASALSLGLFVGPSLGGMLLDYSNFRIGSLYPLVCSLTALILVIVFIIQHDRNGKNEYYKNGADSSESTKLLINSYAGSMSIPRHKEIHGISEPVQKYGN